MSYAHPTLEEVAQRRSQLAPFDGWNERAFCLLIAWNGIPASYLDLGSGTGAMVNMARKIGIQTIGVDVINGPEHWFIHHDLTQPLYIEPKHLDGVTYVAEETNDRFIRTQPMHFQLITCLEVAEHLPLDSHETLVDTIARHMAPGGRLVFSAAPPGQRGEHHIGCRPAHEWRGMFHERGISYREDYTRALSHLWAWTAGPASAWLAANVQVFDTWDGELMQEVG